MCSKYLYWQNEQGHARKLERKRLGIGSSPVRWVGLMSRVRGGRWHWPGANNVLEQRLILYICNRKNIDFLEISLALKEKCVKLNEKRMMISQRKRKMFQYKIFEKKNSPTIDVEFTRLVVAGHAPLLPRVLARPETHRAVWREKKQVIFMKNN